MSTHTKSGGYSIFSLSAFETDKVIPAPMEQRDHDADKIDFSACPAMSKLAYQIDFVLAVRRVIRPKHIMEPDGGLHQHIRSLPGIPWQVGLRLARNHAQLIAAT